MGGAAGELLLPSLLLLVPVLSSTTVVLFFVLAGEAGFFLSGFLARLLRWVLQITEVGSRFVANYKETLNSMQTERTDAQTLEELTS